MPTPVSLGNRSPSTSDTRSGASYELTVASRLGDYRVEIGEGTWERTLAGAGDAVVVADAYFADRVPPGAVLIEATERNKTIGYGEELIARLKEAGARRGTRVIALGGGVVQDLTTFAASMYMRGLPWVYVPTTLMAMADSCIGGKSSLNVGSFKNLAGNFYPPERIAIDPLFIATLPEEDVVSGLAEAVKICFCRGPEAFDEHLERYAAFDERPADLLHHVLESKRWFIEVDEFDQRERRLLNFGHTFAHAAEPAAGFTLAHGVAVAFGVLCANALAQARGVSGARQDRLDAHCRELLGRVPDLAPRLERIDREAFVQAFLGDKKHTRDELRLILPNGDRAEEVALPQDEKSIAAVRSALEATIASLA